MSLEVALMRLYLDGDKEASYRSLLAALGAPNEGPLTDQALALLSRADLRHPKNWRPLDYIQAEARRSLAINGDYTFNKIPVSSRMMFGSIGLERLRDARIVDLGCGVFDPLLQSIYLYCNGAKSVLAVDTEPCADARKAGFLTGDMVTEFLASPDHWFIGAISKDEFLRRAQGFNLKSFRQGDLQTGLNGSPIEYRIGTLQEVCTEPSSQDVVISFSVLEHITDLVDLLAHVRRVLGDEGHFVNQVDFSDHRQFTPGFHFWTFMTKEGPPQPGINGVRASQLKAMLGEAGFKILNFSPARARLPDEVRLNLAAPYSSMEDEDLETISAYFSAAAG